MNQAYNVSSAPKTTTFQMRMNPEIKQRAEQLYEYFKAQLAAKLEGNVQAGIFGADMKVDLLNDGPFTIIMECIGGKIV